MKWALKNGERVLASKQNVKEGVYFCECCGDEVRGRLCFTKECHFAHKSNSDCVYSTYTNNMSSWHREWQNKFNNEYCEILSSDKTHIADIKFPNGLVLEFQHSYISEEEIREREEHYKTMVWIIDGSRNKLPPRMNSICKKPVLIDMGQHLNYLDIKKDARNICKDDFIYMLHQDRFTKEYKPEFLMDACRSDNMMIALMR